MSAKTLIVRQDNLGDVLLAGPCIRAAAAGSDSVTVLAGPRGAAAAALLPGVDEVISWRAPWIDPEPQPLDPNDFEAIRARIAEGGFDTALILTSFHQSPLPTALMLRLAHVPWVGAISTDYPGSLLDLRLHVPEALPEPERALHLAEAAGFALPEGDDGRLALARPLPDIGHLGLPASYVVVHPGASAPARRMSPPRLAAIVDTLAAAGRDVVVTGSPDERPLTVRVAHGRAIDLGGRTDLPELAAVIDRADALVAPNTAAAHVAAAVGTPVVSLFAPVVPAVKWGPYRVPHVLLGDQHAACRDTRARHCPVPRHPCLETVSPMDVAEAVDSLAAATAGI
ncbi:glycosyltransferase family 9 protein [Glycomyces sp. TRM65418]|uniref:glycosyltransferase family 9 protein n=1 Tax=Glycomyces sp. TRM65418 TaxID=2867006 RepID=UPI001CE5B0CE|nr:glycosyltransferase family 9 protein [Glycomyces sp. TRM65418]MCC3761862.1 glycosyltransferase family 9 protein [Glycomyces sp. TRM65418]QZD55943.1 glycosyltransferase family 9 protein [Glycomyces sp. TRM65418]